ncbi:hypothetical protein [Virgisporangium aurantiacum]|uniref:PH domain-containing protein n=1 Tax=Virgisporangium aurantiacum TaxID=175570 RepID=A0A8J3ZC46_9ACTN|nr:hypothetical protein [Virgisporangium aurantiacum]GIJ61474.1 hypothetical protein Vau01_089900 [Virgisporangium aurantiacum]
MELHRHWKTGLYGPLWILVAIGCFLAPTLILPALRYEFFVGNWIAYPAGAVLLLIGAYTIRDHSKPYLLRFDETGVVWRVSNAHGAVPWHDVVRFGLEKKPDDAPRVKPKHLTLWLRHPLPGAGDPDVELQGLAGYRLAEVGELVESAEQIVAGLRRYTPALETVTGAAGATAFVEQFGGAPASYGDRRAPAEGECAVCGSAPASFVVLQSVVSAAVFHWTSAERGWRCRDCALATYRHLTARTLLGCWWGVGVIGGPVVVLANRLRMRPALRLGPPQPTPGVAALSPRPLDPGPRVLARPGGIVGTLVGVVLTLLVAFVIFALATT